VSRVLIDRSDRMNSAQMAQQIAAHFASPEHADHTRILGLLVRRLADGAPIGRAEAARLLGCDETELNERVDRLPVRVEQDDQGRIVGAVLTQRPTRHEFVMEGRRLYTWCALDLLIFPVLLGRSARVSSPCGATGRTVSITISPHGVLSADPAEAVVSVVTPAKDSRDLRQSFCVHVNFFASREAAHAWTLEHPGAAVLDLQQAFVLAQQLARSFDLKETCTAAGACAAT
jgi:alkylmercury lyase